MSQYPVKKFSLFEFVSVSNRVHLFMYSSLCNQPWHIQNYECSGSTHSLSLTPLHPKQQTWILMILRLYLSFFLRAVIGVAFRVSMGIFPIKILTLNFHTYTYLPRKRATTKRVNWSKQNNITLYFTIVTFSKCRIEMKMSYIPLYFVWRLWIVAISPNNKKRLRWHKLTFLSSIINFAYKVFLYYFHFSLLFLLIWLVLIPGLITSNIT